VNGEGCGRKRSWASLNHISGMAVGCLIELWVGVISSRELREMPLATSVHQLGRFRGHVDLSFM
jgi:hypothetical protein